MTPLSQAIQKALLKQEEQQDEAIRYTGPTLFSDEPTRKAQPRAPSDGSGGGYSPGGVKNPYPPGEYPRPGEGGGITLPDFDNAGFDEQAGIDRGRGNAAEAAGIDRLMNFDAMDYATTASGAAFDALSEEFTGDLRNLRGRNASIGRLQTGFGFQDEEGMLKDFNTRLSRAIASNALQAGSLDLSAAGALTNAGGNIVNRYLDILTGQRDYGVMLAQLEAANAAQGDQGFDWWGLLGGIGGTILSRLIP